MKVNKKVLKNGMRIITIPMKDNPTATVLVLVEAGTNYEKKRKKWNLSFFRTYDV